VAVADRAPDERHDGRVPDRLLARARHAALTLAVLLVASACVADDADRTTTPGATGPAAPTASLLTFEQAVAALTPDLVPAVDVQPCRDDGPGPEQERPEDAPAAPAPAPAPAPRTCGDVTVESLRAGSLTGFAHGPADEVVLPVAGGAARVVGVYEHADVAAAAAAYAARVADPDGWAADQEIPAEELDGGFYQPRRVVGDAQLVGVDLPGWTAAVLSRDEAAYAHDGSVAAAPVSYAHLWAFRDALVVHVQVAGDEPGQASGTAVATVRAFAAGVGGGPPAG